MVTILLGGHCYCVPQVADQEAGAGRGSVGTRWHLLQWIPGPMCWLRSPPRLYKGPQRSQQQCAAIALSLTQCDGIVLLTHQNLRSPCSRMYLLVFFACLKALGRNSTTVRIVMVLHSPLRPANSLRTVGAQCLCWVNRTQNPRQVMVVPPNFCQPISFPSLTFLICKMEFIDNRILYRHKK